MKQYNLIINDVVYSNKLLICNETELFIYLKYINDLFKTADIKYDNFFNYVNNKSIHKLSLYLMNHKNTLYKIINDSDFILIDEYHKFNRISPTSIDEVIHTTEINLYNYFDTRNISTYKIQYELCNDSNKFFIPFCISNDANISYSKTEAGTFNTHCTILKNNNNEINKYYYRTSLHNEHNMYCDEGIQGLQLSIAYEKDKIDKPFELKYSHIKAIEEFIRKAENNEL